MTTTLTVPGLPSITVLMVTRFTERREYRHRVHQLLAASATGLDATLPDVDVTIRTPGPRTGTLELWCPSRSVAATVGSLLRFATIQAVAHLADDGIGDLYFLPTGQTEMAPDPQVPARWIVRVDYTQVPGS